MTQEPQDGGEALRKRVSFRVEALEAHRRARGARVVPPYVARRTLVLLWGTSLLLLGSLVGLGLSLMNQLRQG